MWDYIAGFYNAALAWGWHHPIVLVACPIVSVAGLFVHIHFTKS